MKECSKLKEFNKVNGFKNLKFQSVIPQDILQAVELLEKLGYEVGYDFSVDDAAKHNGICAWEDGEITEGWLNDDSFEQVTLEDLKEMVGAIKDNQLVLWLNKETLEERYLDKFSVFPYSSSWVEVPEGATFATGNKDNFVFRKDGWYYEDGEWVETNALLKHFPEYKHIKLFWVKCGKDNVFILERLLGCEVKILGEVGHIDESVLELVNYFSDKYDLPATTSLQNLTFFTEDGDELTFDEYVVRYYGVSV